MKTKVTIAGLVLALLLAPRLTAEPKPQPQNAIIMIGCGLIVLIGGTIVTIKLYQLCKRIPALNEPPPTNAIPPMPPLPTNSIPTNNIPTNRVPHLLPSVSLNDSSVSYLNVSSLGMKDQTGATVVYYARMKLQASSQVRAWQDLYTVTVWVSLAGTEFLWESPEGTPLLTNYCPNGGVAEVPLTTGTASEPVKFFRLLSQ